MIGIIGGTGICNILENQKDIKLHTPYGAHSDVTKGTLNGQDVIMCFRHNKNHSVPPHKINFHANMFALKSLDVDQIVSLCATGSLKEEYMPGDIVLPNQFLDFSFDVTTFYHGPQVHHVSMSDPFCERIRTKLANVMDELGMHYKYKGTYLRIAGPQFSTRAASQFYKQHADLIGMTGVPEAILAKEQAMCCAILATITDYDNFSEKPVDIQEIIKTMKENEEKIIKILKNVIPALNGERTCVCKNALNNAQV